MSSPFLSYSSDRYKTNPADKHIRYLDENAILYRLVPSHWYDEKTLMDADAAGPRQKRGRWNKEKQGTIYTANNVLICFAERLYHMYIGAMNNLSVNKCSCKVESKYLECKHHLAIVELKEKIERLVHVSDTTTYSLLNAGLRGSLLIHPYPEDSRLHQFAGKLRRKHKKRDPWNGIAYPSARHRTDPLSSSQEWYSAYALFHNESEKVLRTEDVIVTLKLISDSQDLSVKPSEVQPHSDHYLHASIGYFEFTSDPSDPDSEGNIDKVDHLRDNQLLMPAFDKNFGYIDFIRRTYKSYPDDAVI